ncbi:hypothetical protein AMTRI_Chr04g185160 [Amborella trichopoda]
MLVMFGTGIGTWEKMPIKNNNIIPIFLHLKYLVIIIIIIIMPRFLHFGWVANHGPHQPPFPLPSRGSSLSDPTHICNIADPWPHLSRLSRLSGRMAEMVRVKLALNH